MSEFPETDLDTLRQSRIARLEAELHELAGRLTHLHWPSTEAEVTDCRLPRRSWIYGARGDAIRIRLGWTVGFFYSVDGKRYTGVLDSPVEVESGDRFALRYNPEHPDENNSLCSKNSMGSLYSGIATAVLAAIIFFLFIKEHFFRN